MVDTAREVERAFPGTIASGFGHLGDGNVHFHARPGPNMSANDFGDQSPAITRLVHDLVTAAGGSISAEHGIGQMKREELARLAPQRVAALKAIKQALAGNLCGNIARTMAELDERAQRRAGDVVGA